MLLFGRLKGLATINRDLVEKESKLVVRFFSNLDQLQKRIFRKDLNLISNGIEMLNILLEDKAKMSSFKSDLIDNFLISISKYSGRYWDGYNSTRNHLVGSTVVIKKDIVFAHISKLEKLLEKN